MIINSQQFYNMLTFFRELDKTVVWLDMLWEEKKENNLSNMFIDFFGSLTSDYLASILFWYIFESPMQNKFEHLLDKDERKLMDELSKIWKIENSDDGFIFIQEFTDNVYLDDVIFIKFLEILWEIEKTEIVIDESSEIDFSRED